MEPQRLSDAGLAYLLANSLRTLLLFLPSQISLWTGLVKRWLREGDFLKRTDELVLWNTDAPTTFATIAVKHIHIAALFMPTLCVQPKIYVWFHVTWHLGHNVNFKWNVKKGTRENIHIHSYIYICIDILIYKPFMNIQNAKASFCLLFHLFTPYISSLHLHYTGPLVLLLMLLFLTPPKGILPKWVGWKGPLLYPFFSSISMPPYFHLFTHQGKANCQYRCIHCTRKRKHICINM